MQGKVSHRGTHERCVDNGDIYKRHNKEIVWIELTIVSLNTLQVMAANIMNAYITVLNEENIWTTLGLGFSREMGCKAIVVRALYGLKSVGAAFRKSLS